MTDGYPAASAVTRPVLQRSVYVLLVKATFPPGSWVIL